jgi:hypothetical protein
MEGVIADWLQTRWDTLPVNERDNMNDAYAKFLCDHKLHGDFRALFQRGFQVLSRRQEEGRESTNLHRPEEFAKERMEAADIASVELATICTTDGHNDRRHPHIYADEHGSRAD